MAGPTVSRRAAVRTLCALGFGGLAATSAAGSDHTPPGRCKRNAHGTPPAATEALVRDDDAYIAAVDRIVDGEHVVLILEEGGDPVEQLVVPLSEYPVFEETGVFLLTLEDDEIADARPLRGETKRRRRRNRDRLDCLTGDLEDADAKDDDT
ncbi:hypothetical protein [Natrononativus amylolyticus]|uniref:hypothetical protein n=1 Tax=Natrononativus amylolyticus TaxID=2963434 RepID=UPI0020CC2BDE|nr:hypothetical protein [Natrononativus amylolyticus]